MDEVRVLKTPITMAEYRRFERAGLFRRRYCKYCGKALKFSKCIDRYNQYTGKPARAKFLYNCNTHIDIRFKVYIPIKEE